MAPRTRTAPHTAHLLIDGARIPVLIFTERRRDCRVSIGKTGIRIRLASGLGREERDRHVRELIGWAERQVRRRGWPHPEPRRRYVHGELVWLAGQPHRIDVTDIGRPEVTATLEAGRLRLHVPADLPADERDEALTETVAHVCRRHFGDWVSHRVARLNERHFGYRYEQVRLKHNRSNWGSCSVAGNLNLNVRLLLAPLEVLDYVIVHELAHLKQHDHSRAYWRLVERAMPDYRRHVDWLRIHGAECIF
jgi:predicted metal-dependent hydrolase